MALGGESGIIQGLEHLRLGVVLQLQLPAVHVDGGHSLGLQHLPGVADGLLLLPGVAPLLQGTDEVLPVQPRPLGKLRQNADLSNVLLLQEIGPVDQIVVFLSPAPLAGIEPASKARRV